MAGYRIASLGRILLAGALAGCAGRQAPVESLPAPSARFSALEELVVSAAGVDEPLPMVRNDSAAGERLLREPSLPVEPDDPLAAHLASRMAATLELEQGVGIAAPQVGINRRLVIVQRQDLPEEPFQVCYNPVIVESSEEQVLGWEGCLSIPAGFGQVERAQSVEVVYDLADGSHHHETVQGWTARIFQHELDHLDGTLFVDRMVSESLVPKEEYRRLRQQEADTGE